MIDKFVSYNQAIKLKKIGFYEDCLAKYDPIYGLVFGQIKVNIKNYKSSTYMLAPLCEQMFDFFRNKGIDSAVLKDRYIIQISGEPQICYDGFECYNDAKNSCIEKIFELYLEKYKEGE